MFKVTLRSRPRSAYHVLKFCSNTTLFNIQKDTIYALSSGPITKSGVSVIRMSGPASLKCLQVLSNAHNANAVAHTFKERVASLRHLYCPLSKEKLDQSIVLYFPGPNSFTGEDVVELHVHGSRAVVSAVFDAFRYLDSKLTMGTIRPAERGEFTRRAFENGRMDLTEVEGLADLLDADTSKQRQQALRQMDGHLRKTYEQWRQELVRCLAHTEAVIDFGDDDREDDVSDAALYALIPRVQVLLEELQRHLQSGKRGEMVREGVRIALVGPPNAGKSSLLNALARRPAAIVSPIAGTTRDVVEVCLDLDGLSCVVSDTAGLRGDSSDPVELEGMRRARDEFGRAHVKVFVADASDSVSLQAASAMMDSVLRDIDSQSLGLERRKTSDSYAARDNVIVVLNKSDLAKQSEEVSGLDIFGAAPRHSISCTSGQGLEELESALTAAVQRLLEVGTAGDSPLITRERHRRHVLQCTEHLQMFLTGRLPMDAAAEELRLAMLELGKVTGLVDVEELLDVIFRDFCIGK